MKHYLYTLLDILFPPTRDERVLRSVSDDVFLHLAQVNEDGGIVALLPYQDPTVKAALHLAKFHHHPRATRLLGLVLAHYLREHTPLTIVPIPLSKKRFRERGYNQVLEILKVAKPETYGHTVLPHLLSKHRHTAPQTSLRRTERLQNLVDAFTCDQTFAQHHLPNQHILIIDDVTTTGATLTAAKDTLLPYTPASITLLALAH
jgi:ComF family protein